MSIKRNELFVVISNIVVKCFINTKFNNRFIAKQLLSMGVQYNPHPRGFQASVFRMRMNESRKVAVLLYDNGEIVCTGAKSEEEAWFYIQFMVDKIVECGFDRPSIPLSSKRCNVVGTVWLPKRIQLKPFAIYHSGFVTYEQEIFPGAIVEPPDVGSVTILVFQTGRVVITGGGQKENDIEEALDIIANLVEPFYEGSIAPVPATLPTTAAVKHSDPLIAKKKPIPESALFDLASDIEERKRQRVIRQQKEQEQQQQQHPSEFKLAPLINIKEEECQDMPNIFELFKRLKET